MVIRSCKTNHLTNPLGYAMERVNVSWITESEVSARQAAARVRVAKDDRMEKIIYDTGNLEKVKNTGTLLPIALQPYTRYYWQVRVWGDAGDTACSPVNWFETGKYSSEWDADWITTPWADKDLHPLMRREFFLEEIPEQARLYLTGAGLFEIRINYKKVGKEYLAPGCCGMDNWTQCYTYDVTEYLEKGRNQISVMFGNGWAKGRFCPFKSKEPYVDRFWLLAELHAWEAEERRVLVATDEMWECAPGPVVEDGIYDGEVYDARIKADNWEYVRKGRPEGLGALCERRSLPVYVKETCKPQKLILTPKGESVIDMGQNMVGWLRVYVDEPEGTMLRISYGEILQDGCFYRGNLRSARAEYVFISDGRPQTAEPHFSYYGFRYAKVEGITHPINLDNFTGCVVYSDLEKTGRILTSQPLLNRLFENAMWSQKGNFLEIPTDCPQRDERMGWTGDAQIFAKTASYNMDTYAFYSKMLYDTWMEQKNQKGMAGNIVPSFTREKSDTASIRHGGVAGWGDAVTIIPWMLYEHYGDSEILRAQYESMKSWVEWIRRQDKSAGNRRLWTTGFQLGDWLALDGLKEERDEGGTDKGLIASAYYKHSVELTAKAAHVLGKTEDEEEYTKLAEEIRQAVREAWYVKGEDAGTNTQTAYVLALEFGLVEETEKKDIARRLAGKIQENGIHLSTGFIGTPYLCGVLSDYGYGNLAYQLLMQRNYPGWLYEVLMGATTIWERWDSVLEDGTMSGEGMNSLNHYAYGSIVQWMYEHMCGIRQREGSTGFEQILIRPELYGPEFEAHAEYFSPKGIIRSGFLISEGKYVTIDVTVPFDSEAVVYLPEADFKTARAVKIVGTNEVQVEDVCEELSDYGYLTLQRGEYQIAYQTAQEQEAAGK